MEYKTCASCFERKKINTGRTYCKDCDYTNRRIKKATIYAREHNSTLSDTGKILKLCKCRQGFLTFRIDQNECNFCRQNKEEKEVSFSRYGVNLII